MKRPNTGIELEPEGGVAWPDRRIARAGHAVARTMLAVAVLAGGCAFAWTGEVRPDPAPENPDVICAGPSCPDWMIPGGLRHLARSMAEFGKWVEEASAGIGRATARRAAATWVRRFETAEPDRTCRRGGKGPKTTAGPKPWAPRGTAD